MLKPSKAAAKPADAAAASDDPLLLRVRPRWRPTVGRMVERGLQTSCSSMGNAASQQGPHWLVATMPTVLRCHAGPQRAAGEHEHVDAHAGQAGGHVLRELQRLCMRARCSLRPPLLLAHALLLWPLVLWLAMPMARPVCSPHLQAQRLHTRIAFPQVGAGSDEESESDGWGDDSDSDAEEEGGEGGASKEEGEGGAGDGNTTGGEGGGKEGKEGGKAGRKRGAGDYDYFDEFIDDEGGPGGAGGTGSHAGCAICGCMGHLALAAGCWGGTGCLPPPSPAWIFCRYG